MAEPSCQNIRGGSKGPSSGSSAQCAALPAGEERVSDSPAAVPACAPLSLRVSVPGSESPVLEQQTSGPLPSLCAFLLCTPIDNGWQLPAPGTEVRPASLFAQPSAPPTPFSTRGGGGGGLTNLPRDCTVLPQSRQRTLHLQLGRCLAGRGAFGDGGPWLGAERGAGCGLWAGAAGIGDSRPPPGPGSGLRSASGSRSRTQPREVSRLVERLVSQVWVKTGGNRTRANYPTSRPSGPG